jgi:hypothetical protein
MTDRQRITLGSIIFLILFSIMWIFIFHNEHKGHNCKFVIYDSHNVKYCTSDYKAAGPNCIQFYDQRHNGETIICGSFIIKKINNF